MDGSSITTWGRYCAVLMSATDDGEDAYGAGGDPSDVDWRDWREQIRVRKD